MSRMRKKSKRKIESENADQEEFVPTKTKKVTYKWVFTTSKDLTYIYPLFFQKRPSAALWMEILW